MQRRIRRTAIGTAALVLLGLGLVGATLLPNSGAQGTITGTYTYPTYTYPTSTNPTTSTTTPTTTTEETSSTQETTTAPGTTTAADTTTTTTTTSAVSTTTSTTTPPRPAASGTSRFLRARHDAGLNAELLVDQHGMTLYHLTLERNRTIRCTGGCPQTWPPLLLAAGTKPLAGKGVNSRKLGWIRRPGGRLQWTYAGFPLYRFSGDQKPGDAKGEGIDGVWFAVGASGRIVRS